MKIKTHAEWEVRRLTGRSGKKKIRRDTTLTKRDDGVLEFRYGNKDDDVELLATLTRDDVYTISKDDSNYFYPTYGNIFMLVVGIATYNDSSHYKHYANKVRINLAGARYGWNEETSKWERKVESMPFTNGLQFKNGKCLNPEIAVDYKRTLNRAKSLPLLRRTETLAKVLRVATRIGVLERDEGTDDFKQVNFDDPTADDAQIILRAGSAQGLWRARRKSPEEQLALLRRCAENGLADFREWLYTQHGCYEMLAVETKGEEQ